MSLLQRSWTTLRVRSFSGGRPQLRPHHPRLLGFATGWVSGPGRSNVFALALGCALMGMGGYYVGTRSNAPYTAVSALPKPVYGTSEDFARAIEDLKISFAEDAVTIAEDQLRAHGFSLNTHLPGTPDCSDEVVHRLFFTRVSILTLAGFLYRVST
jgi:hypothetical protein